MAPIQQPRADALGTFIVELFALNGVLLSEGDRITRDLGLSSARWQVLGAVELAGHPLSVSQIARNMGLTRQSVQRVVNELNADGLSVLEDNPNHQRAKNVALTAKGRRVFRAAMQRQSEWGCATLTSAGVGGTQLAQAEKLMRRLRETLTEKKK